MPKNVLRYALAAGIALVGWMPLQAGVAFAQQKGGVLNVATVGEPPTLDPMVSSADLVSNISQHALETLFTFDENWKVVPLLAQSLPDISADGKVYTIAIRQGVKFHDGTTMTAHDVALSLKRWTALSARGKEVAKVVQSIDEVDSKTVRITLKDVYAPLMSFLALNNSAAVVLPAAHMEDPLKELIGTGPYMLKERKPDQYIRLVRFDGYQSPPGPSSRYGGARGQYLDEIRFVPVPDDNTRVEGAVAGQYDYADQISVDSYDRLTNQPKTAPSLLKPYGFPFFILNTKAGVLADLNLRKAVQVSLNEGDMLAAAFGTPDFYAVDGAMYPPGYVWNTDAGTAGNYNVADVAKAKAFMAKAKYDGKPIRILTSHQYEFLFKMAQVAAENLRSAGFQVDLQVSDWATLTQHRANPAQWEMYTSYSNFLAEPALIDSLSDSWPGWWSTPAKAQAVGAFNATADPGKRVKLWADVQKVIFDEVPVIKVGDFNSLAALSPRVQGAPADPSPYFWNAWLKQ